MAKAIVGRLLEQLAWFLRQVASYHSISTIKTVPAKVFWNHSIIIGVEDMQAYHYFIYITFPRIVTYYGAKVLTPELVAIVVTL